MPSFVKPIGVSESRTAGDSSAIMKSSFSEAEEMDVVEMECLHMKVERADRTDNEDSLHKKNDQPFLGDKSADL